MSLSLFRRTTPAPARRPRSTRQSFALESLEERTVMSAAAAVMPDALPAVHVGKAAAAQVSVPITITGVNLTGLTTNAQNLVTGATGTVSGTLAGQTFTNVPFSIGSSTNAAGVPVLDLHLGPIDLNVLGLEVKTSEICLNITAQPGPGNLLGNLVGGLANALNGTQSATGTGLLTTLNGLIGSLTGKTGTATTATGALNTLLSTATTGANGQGSSSLLGLLGSGLSSALGQLTPSAASPSDVTNLVHLSVGPLNLDLLGLVVNLDNCHGGPVTVDINAIPGSGNLLGNLLGGLAHALDGPGQGLHVGIDRALISILQNL